ncbi:MAG: SMC-Scp complex subunit ScpB [Rheinheimera sp.]|nr:SMC-Scp complex subunit ScpB [Rheinheimera sp.]
MATKIQDDQLVQLLEACLFASEKPLSQTELLETVLADFQLSKKRLQAALTRLEQDYQGRGIGLVETASGWQFQTQCRVEPVSGETVAGAITALFQSGAGNAGIDCLPSADYARRN